MNWSKMGSNTHLELEDLMKFSQAGSTHFLNKLENRLTGIYLGLTNQLFCERLDLRQSEIIYMLLFCLKVVYEWRNSER